MSFTLQSVLDHFGLKKRPFTLLPDPAFLYMSPQHLNAQSILDYGIASRAKLVQAKPRCCGTCWGARLTTSTSV